MATILDAHPRIAMTYETYEHLLSSVEPEGLRKATKRQVSSAAKSHLLHPVFLKLKRSDSDFVKFVARAQRSGIEPESLSELFAQHFASGLGLGSFRERMVFVENLSREKMKREGKKCWGAKIASVYDELDEVYPESRYLFMLRDGRDVVASRKKVGNFHQAVDYIAEGWSRQIAKFEEFAARSVGRAFFVSYERLASNPEGELRNLMTKLELPWADELLSFQTLDLTIHRKPMGHLSAEGVSSEISTASIGRWKKDLTRDEGLQFESVAGDTLQKYGYL